MKKYMLHVKSEFGDTYGPYGPFLSRKDPGSEAAWQYIRGLAGSEIPYEDLEPDGPGLYGSYLHAEWREVLRRTS